MIPIVIGTHEYEWALQIFGRLFSKYFGSEKVIYIGDKVEISIPDNLEFVSVPCFREGSWPWKNWFGEGLLSICDMFKDEIICLFLPDHWLNSPVDKSTIGILEIYMNKHPEIIRANLTADQSWDEFEVEQVENFEGLDIVEVKPWSIHIGYNGGMSFCPSLWRPELIKTVIKPYWSLWDCERLGTDYIKQHYPLIRAIGSKPAALKRTHGLFHSEKTKSSLQELCEEDKELVISYLPKGYTTC